MTNKDCKFAGEGYCMCSTCQAVREALESAGKITKEEVDKIFHDAEKSLDIKQEEK